MDNCPGYTLYEPIKISEGMSADDVLKVLGGPRAIKVLRIKDFDSGVPNLVVEWTYRSIRLTLARRERDGVTCYRVIKKEVLDE